MSAATNCCARSPGILSERLGDKAQAHRLGGDEFAITCEEGNVPWVENMLSQAVADMRASGFEFCRCQFRLGAYL